MPGRYLSVRRVVGVLAETAILIAAFAAATSIRLLDPGGHADEYQHMLSRGLVTAAAIQICLYYSDLYEEYAMRRRVEILLRFAQAFFFAILALSVVYYFIPSLKIGRGIFVIYLPLSLAGILAWRTAYMWTVGREALSDAVLILGTGPSARSIAEEILQRTPLGFRVVGFLGEQQAEVGKRIVNPSVIGTIDELVPIVERNRISLILVALDDRRGKMPVADLLHCRLGGVRVEEAPSFYERLTGKILVKNLRPSWLVFSQGFNKPRLLRNTKRLGELAGAAVLLVVLAPVMGLIAILVKFGSPGPVLYGQERVGEKGRPFVLYKFRSMRADAESKSGPIWASSDGDPRVTRLGWWLRKTRLDELPQIINVLRGEMSFVGPRPERPHFVDQLRKIIPYYDERHSVKPGITGWAQIKFHYGSTIEDAEEKLQFDLYYIKHMSWIFDVGIILETLKVAFGGKGAR
jgi:sugar transferase (PEP-CTERM system associated)